MEDEHTKEVTEGSATYPVQCSSLRKNGYVMLKGRPCKIVEMTTSKTGKHGHAKVHLVGIDIFTNKKYEDLCPSTHNIDVPNINRREFTVIDFDEDGFATMMDDACECRSDLKLPEGELGEKIKSEVRNSDGTVVVTVLSAVGEEAIVATKNTT